MKIIFHSLMVLICTLSLQAQAARTGGGFDHDNGGDSCESTFKNVRDNLTSWIIKGGAQDLRFPEGVTHDAYQRAMIRRISSAKIDCTDKQIFVGGAEKTCKNFFEADGTPSILCNRNRFMSTVTSDRYMLVHHEYAGLAGFEMNVGENSNYKISNQIVRNLAGARLTTVKLMLDFITKSASIPNTAASDLVVKGNSFCMFIGRISQGDVTQELYRDLISLDTNLSRDVFPDSRQTFEKLRINLKGLQNYCYEGFFKEDPNPVAFNNIPALQIRIKEIQKQLSVIENYLNKRFPEGTL
jgi:hypothetical protein